MSRLQYSEADETETIFVTDVATPLQAGQSFSAQLCKYPEALPWEIGQELQSQPKQIQSVVQRGDHVRVSCDNQECRAEVVTVGESESLLDLVDFGGVRVFPNTEICSLSDELCSKWSRVAANVLLAKEAHIYMNLETKLHVKDCFEIDGVTYFYGEIDQIDPATVPEGTQTTLVQQHPGRPVESVKTNGVHHEVLIPQPELGDTAEVLVVTSESSGNEYRYGLQLISSNAAAIEAEMEQLFADPTNRIPVTDFHGGQYVVSLFGTQYCRAIILNVDSDSKKAHIMHIDYGSDEWVDSSSLLEILPGLMSSQPCCAISATSEQLLTGQLTVKIASSVMNEFDLRLYKVREWSAEVDGVGQVGQNGQVDKAIPPAGADSLEKTSYPALVIDAGRTTLYVALIDGDCIATQLGCYDVQELLDMNTALTKAAAEQGKHRPATQKAFEPGDLVAVEIEDCYYRAQVSEILGDKISIYQVDFGIVSTETPESLTALPDGFRDYPQVGCRVKASPEQLEQLSSSGSFEVCNLKLVSRANFVDIYEFDLVSASEPDGPVVLQSARPEMLIPEEEIATEIKYPEFENAPERVYVLMASDGLFGFQFCRFSVEHLTAIDNELLNYMVSRPELKPDPVSVGDFVAIEDEQGCYRRGQIAVFGEIKCAVLIDHGTVVACSEEMLRLPKRFERLERVGAVVEATFSAQVGEELDLIATLVDGGLKVERYSSPSQPVSGENLPGSEAEDLPEAEVEATNVTAHETNFAEVIEDKLPIFEPQGQILVEVPCSSNGLAEESAAKHEFSLDQSLGGNSGAETTSGYAGSPPREIIASVNLDGKASYCDSTPSSTFSVNSDTLEADLKSLSFRDTELDVVCSEMSFDVIVTAIHRPTKVCVVKRRLVTSAKSTSESLTNRAADLRPVDAGSLELGSVVVAKLQMNPARFGRAKIVHFNHHTELYKVFLIDSGAISRVPLTSLFELPANMSVARIPAHAKIVQLAADELAYDRDAVERIFSGVLRCSLSYPTPDMFIPGELCHRATLQNRSGDVVEQLAIKGFVTTFTERFSENPLVVPGSTATEFLDAIVVSVDKLDDQGNANVTLLLVELMERMQRMVVDKQQLKPLYALDAGTPALVYVENDDQPWKRARVIGRPHPGQYRVYLVDAGIEINHPVSQTFKCPANLINLPEAAIEMPIQARESRIGADLVGRMVAVKPKWNIDRRSKKPPVEIFDLEGNSIAG